MKRVFFVAASLAAVAGLLKLTPVRVTGQTPAAKTDALAPAKGAGIMTPWGEPDLQGIWTDIFATPLQRNPKFGTREFFTDEERADLDKKRAARLDHDYRAERGTENDVAGAYNAVYHLRTKTGRRTSLIVDPPDGRMPPYTAQVKERRVAWREYDLALLQATKACKNQEASCAGGKYGPPSPRFFGGIAPFYPTEIVNRSDDPEDRGLGERCLGGSNLEFGNVNGFGRRIVQTPGDISIYHDSGQGQGWQRNIVMNGSPHLPAHVRQWWGDSRGHWEGNTLVIDVTNITPKQINLESRGNLHLVERFTRTGPDTIEYMVTVEDPTTWERPWTVKQEYTKQSDEQNRLYIEPRCHEGNYGLAALLRGARVIDDEFAKKRGQNPAEVYIAPTSAEKLGATDNETDADLNF
jgi:hypothetical protein